MMQGQVSAKKEEKDQWAYSICAGCYNLCGVKIKVVDGVPVAIESVPESDLGGKGGGRPTIGQGKFPDVKKAVDAIREAIVAATQ